MDIITFIAVLSELNKINMSVSQIMADGLLCMGSDKSYGLEIMISSCYFISVNIDTWGSKYFIYLFIYLNRFLILTQ